VTINRWAEYDAGTLTPPVVVQQDQVGGEYLVWLWTGTSIEGPMSRTSFDEAAFIAQWQAAEVERLAAEAERRAEEEFERLVSD
jgi:hypothetical protein